MTNQMEMNNHAQCALCGALVPVADASAHLAEQHPTPPEGFTFLFNGESFVTDRPSMSISELFGFVGRPEAGPSLYTLWQDDRQVVGTAVDLTRKPSFVLVPPATW